MYTRYISTIIWLVDAKYFKSTLIIKYFLGCIVLMPGEVMSTLDIQRHPKNRDIIKQSNIREIVLKKEGFMSSR